jgi:hypothetical protein
MLVCAAMSHERNPHSGRLLEAPDEVQSEQLSITPSAGNEMASVEQANVANGKAERTGRPVRHPNEDPSFSCHASVPPMLSSVKLLV